MKWTVCGALISIAILSCVPVFSKQDRVTLSLEKAKHYHATSVGKTYIEADRFLRKSNANYYKDIVQSKTKYTVSVIRHNGFYFVTVGPISSAAEIRKTAGKLSNDSGSVEPKVHTKAVSVPKKHSVQQANKTKQPVQVKQPVLVKQSEQAKQPVQDPVRAKHPAKQPEQAKQNSLSQAFSSGVWLVSVGAGTEFPNFSSSMTVNNGSGAPAPYNQDIYTTKSRVQPVAALSVGRRWARDNRWLPAFSVNMAYQHLFSRNIGGSVIQYSNPTFTNYGYDWEISSDVLLALLKMNVFQFANVAPYILGGAGGAYNRSSNYSEGALPGVTPRTSPGFESYSSVQYAYRIGAGIDFQVDPHVILSAEYQYQDVGSVSSKHGTGNWSGQLLSLGSFKSNAVLLNVTYLFDKQLA